MKLSEQIIIFSHLKSFADDLERGCLRGSFRDMDVEGIRDTVEAIKLAADAKAAKTL